MEVVPAQEVLQQTSILSAREDTAIVMNDRFIAEEITPVVTPVVIDLPKEPFNKKAKAAQIFFVLAKLTVIAAFIVSLFSLLSTVFIVAGVAALFALLAMLFGTLAKKEIAAQPPYERELGEKEATHVIYRAMAGFASAVFIVLLALLIEWIKRQ